MRVTQTGRRGRGEPAAVPNAFRTTRPLQATFDILDLRCNGPRLVPYSQESSRAGSWLTILRFSGERKLDRCKR